MSFLDPAFLLFLGLVFAGFRLLSYFRLAFFALLLLFFSSLVFYSYHYPPYLLLLLTVSILAFVGGRISGGYDGPGRGIVFAIFLALILSPLFFYKYWGFFFDLVFSLSLYAGLSADLAGQEVSAGLSVLDGLDTGPMAAALPLGISFYTFQNISYLSDCYRRSDSEKSLLNYLIYISFFPQLVAGPVVHARVMLPQIREQRFFSADISAALFFLISGYLKKAVLADQLAAVVDPAFDDPGGGLRMAMATFAYTMQIYFDFSGYSDMAIGFGKLFGFSLPENFRNPYSSPTVREFWQRWHITLSSWLRDHIYIPLGGSRLGQGRMVFALFITMFLGGLWHGAHINFIIWGSMHGILIYLDRLMDPYLSKLFAFGSNVSRFSFEGFIFALFRVLVFGFFRVRTFILIALLWVPFRTGSYEDGFERMLFVFQEILFFRDAAFSESDLRVTLLCFLSLVVGSFLGRPSSRKSPGAQGSDRYDSSVPGVVPVEGGKTKIHTYLDGFPPYIRAVFYAIALLCIILLSPGSEEFVYFVF